ncbi:IS1634 family transposase [Parashewanella curva]|uniref:IS1634 family transposase n=1 Tax=Parashewanella curva TaxID=2338552 RepID=A0A3L8PRY5_9GAMM|nr:IS1634 family transposase [Parashewanella curva]
MAERVLEHLNIKPTAVHLDITSFHVDGKYETKRDNENDAPTCIELVKGYSRDHRPELNQVVLEMISENQAGIPIYMQALSGNTNDQKAFLKLSREHIDSLKAAAQSRYLIGDAALYTEETIKTLHDRGRLFVTRVPQTLKEAKSHIEQAQLSEMEELGNGYHGSWATSHYAGVPQQWLIVKSEQDAKQQQATLERNITKHTSKEQKQLSKLMNQGFACELDAQKALSAFESTLKWCELIETTIVKKAKYQRSGRPKKGEQPEGYQYFITGATSQ